ncbi:MAG: hypothetical protein A2W93_16000 [Bacteroidetes bacterium GWF2_43_63]|nr:MAG: hypothetical protein A2W94_13390 [Bacteroidetes bacterium GWE2_42_42]OFY53169.1 MAG: hypothetical protein A2W93_16000 [Bacteroidetes bacterium GWF2_43_63]HBG70316.1 CBS domain-containing protein [Bacteroidales bacterium]HCB60637.1 CBS domain-containing protein [Bacteroidales bacterium]HCY23006.1 CBS domain-containing protein [Bacteroidales bacterium]
MSLFAADINFSAIPSVKTSTSASEALTLMEEYKITHLAIVNNEEYLGLVSEDDLLGLNDFEQPIGNIKLMTQGASVSENAHIFDILRTIYQHKLSLIPVTGKNNILAGVILSDSVLRVVAELLSVNNPGGIIIIEMNVIDYSLTQISNIVESNDALIIASFVRTMPNSTMMQLVLKVNNSDIGKILQTFTRYEYNVVASFGEDMIDDILQDRYELLMRYLNM